MSNTLLAVQSSNFDLKNETVELFSDVHASRTVAMSVATLEGLRAEGAVSASKNGLEVITGASCETGAQ